MLSKRHFAETLRFQAYFNDVRFFLQAVSSESPTICVYTSTKPSFLQRVERSVHTTGHTSFRHLLGKNRRVSAAWQDENGYNRNKLRVCCKMCTCMCISISFLCFYIPCDFRELGWHVLRILETGRCFCTRSSSLTYCLHGKDFLPQNVTEYVQRLQDLLSRNVKVSLSACFCKDLIFVVIAAIITSTCVRDSLLPEQSPTI